MEAKHRYSECGLYCYLNVHVFRRGGCLGEPQAQLHFLQHDCIISSHTEYSEPLAGNPAASKQFELKIKRYHAAGSRVDELLALQLFGEFLVIRQMEFVRLFLLFFTETIDVITVRHEVCSTSNGC